jgi:DNA-binding MarR family transcriptional regulator
LRDSGERLRGFGFLLREVSRRYVLRFEARARDIGLTLVQARALVRLEKNEGVSQASLAGLVDVDAMTMFRIVDRMEADGLIERKLDPADRRARRLYLTTKARPLLAEIWRIADFIRAEVLAEIDQTEIETFLDVLQRIHHKLIALETASPSITAARTPKLAETASSRSTPGSGGARRSARSAGKYEK